MNSKKLLSFALLPLVLAPALRAVEVSPILLQVKEEGGGKWSHQGETQEKSLSIELTNTSAQNVSVKVKYYFFDKDVKGKEVAIFKDGEKSATVKAHATSTIQTEKVTAKSNEKHAETPKKGRNGSIQAGKEVPASGQRLVGYGVQVRQDGKVLADCFSEPSLKTFVGGGDR